MHSIALRITFPYYFIEFWLHAVMVEELIAGGQANVTTFTQGGHGYGEEDSMALQGVPQHPDMAGGDGMHMGGVCVLCVVWGVCVGVCVVWAWEVCVCGVGVGGVCVGVCVLIHGCVTPPPRSTTVWLYDGQCCHSPPSRVTSHEPSGTGGTECSQC